MIVLTEALPSGTRGRVRLRLCVARNDQNAKPFDDNAGPPGEHAIPFPESDPLETPIRRRRVPMLVHRDV